MTSPSEEGWVVTPDRTGVKPLHLLHTYNCDSAATVSRTMSSIMLMLIIHVFNSR